MKYSELDDETLRRDVSSLEDRERVLEMRIARPRDFPTDDPAIDAISLKHLRDSLEPMRAELDRRRRKGGRS